MHRLLVHPELPGVLFQQNHVGVYRTSDHGDTWQRIDDGLPYDFGFGLAVHPREKVCWVIPLQPEEYMFRATDGALRVYRSGKRGRGWRKLGQGLPGKNAHVSVLRHGMSSDSLDPCGVYFGTAGGQVFASADEGQTWQAAAEYLPPVYSVTAATIE